MGNALSLLEAAWESCHIPGITPRICPRQPDRRLQAVLDCRHTSSEAEALACRQGKEPLKTLQALGRHGGSTDICSTDVGLNNDPSFRDSEASDVRAADTSAPYAAGHVDECRDCRASHGPRHASSCYVRQARGPLTGKP